MILPELNAPREPFTFDSNSKARQGKHGSSAPILPSALSIILIYPNSGSGAAIIRVAEVELLGHKDLTVSEVFGQTPVG